MMKLRGELRTRDWALCVATAVLIVAGIMFRYLLLPSGREWNRLGSQLGVSNAEHARLVRNLAMKKGVDEEFTRLGPQAYQSESDPMTLAGWLRELEMLARLPSMALNNMKAMPVKQEGAYKIYRVRLSVSGKLPEVLKFISNATHGQSIAGLESFSLRGVQGINMVECGLSLRMIRLMPEGAGAARRAGDEKKEGGHGD